jgi:ribosomal RNA-processing protein 7
MIKTEDRRNKVNKSAEKKKKRKREKGNNVDGGDTIWISKGLKVLDIANFFPI